MTAKPWEHSGKHPWPETLEVYKAHGPSVAALWSGRGAGAVTAGARARGVTGPGQGRRFAPPHDGCPCPQCTGWTPPAPDQPTPVLRLVSNEDAILNALPTGPVEQLDLTVADDWQAHGECLGADPDLFFPERPRGRTIRADEDEPAKRICRACPVRLVCLEYAMAAGEQYGIFGGLDERERRKLQRQRRRGRTG